jgi:hypothetical protein
MLCPTWTRLSTGRALARFWRSRVSRWLTSLREREEAANFRALQVYGLHKRSEVGDPLSAAEDLIAANDPEAAQEAAKRLWDMDQQYVTAAKQALDSHRDLGR